MKTYLNYIFFLLLLCPLFCFSQTTNISGVINSYAQVTYIPANPCVDSITVNSATGFAIGDSVLMIQMQGAVIDSTNTSSFGSIMSYGNAGNYELLKIATITGNKIRFTSSLKKSYSVSGKVQLVTFPHYVNATVAATLTSAPWNGTTGGILAFSVTNTLTLNADINVSGLGFRGGSASPNYYSNWFYDYCFGNSPGRGGKKGEGIAAYFANKEYGRGAQANGGGGGTDINTGAAGGGNFGAGGHGGNNAFSPDTLWGLRGRSIAGGIALSKIFLGGGGGGGHQNNSEGTPGSNGGGIVFIHCANITGNNHFIQSNGIDITAVAGIDGAGGGGAGGSILVKANSFVGNLFVETKGGKGGDQNYLPQCHGNGGGGGGGLVLYSGASFPANVNVSVTGGVRGVGQCNGTADDAANGNPGSIIFNWAISQTVLQAHAGLDATICSGQSTSIGTAALPGLTYQWSNGVNAAIQQVSPTILTTYILTVSNGTCSYAYDTVTVDVKPSPVILCSAVSNCNTTVFINNTTSASSYQWYFGDGDSSVQQAPTHTYTTTGNYNVTLIASNSNGCKDTLQQLINVSQQSVQAAFTSNHDPCSPTISFVSQSQFADSLTWFFGDGDTATTIDPIHSYATQGVHQVTLIAINNCGSDTMVQLIVDTFTIAQALFNHELKKCSGEVTFFNQSQYSTQFYWDFGDGITDTIKNPIHKYLIAGDYAVVLIANPGTLCADTLVQLISITETDTATLFVPNTFTPNDDGLNERFEIVGIISCLPYHIEIYNRWGNLIFETDDITNFWDGKHKGKTVPAGVYYYVLTGVDFAKHGSISVIR